MGSEETPRTAITDQAIDWLVRLDAGHGNSDAFEQWRNADPRHAAAFAQVVATWQRTGDLRGSGIDVPPVPVAVAPVIIPVAEPETVSAPVGMGRRRFMTGMAASVAVAAAGTGYVLSSRRAYAETGVGERRVVQLPGGSRAEINTNSRITWRMGDQLDLWLERGEAAIFVANNAAHGVVAQTTPMIARLGDGRYNLRVHPAGAQLIAFSGVARVTDGDGGAAMILSPGHTLEARTDGWHEAPMSEAALDAATAWQRSEIVFDGMTLSTALAEFNRYLPQPIELGDASLGAVQLGGRFNTDDPQGFLQALHDGFGIASRPEGDHIVLTSANKAT